MLPTPVIYYGKDEPPPEQTRLRAGPLSLVYEGGDLRYVKLGDREILRRIYVAIRDRNWGTIQPVLSNLRLQVSEDTFQIAYDVENREREIDFFWHGTITGEADGTVIFTMDGVARSTFWRNRIGFCVLHPAACDGAQAVVQQVDGTQEKGTLPIFIDKDQPVLPFRDMQAMRHEAKPRVWAEVRFAGDIFEMEDQRNWTDASYKTFCTPLRLPYPAEIQAGTRVVQSITLKLVGEPQTDSAGAGRQAGGEPATAGPAALMVTVDPAGEAAPLPGLGLGMASHDQPLRDQEIARLRALGLQHLRVDLHLVNDAYVNQLRRANDQAQALDLPLEVALFATENVAGELKGLLPRLEEIRPRIKRWLVYPERELFGGGSPTGAVVAAARRQLGDHLAGAPLASGTNSDFILLQRSLPPMDLLDLLTLAITPQVHAFDNASIVETLEAQGMVVTSARRLAGALPVIVSPVTLKPRFNPVASGPIPPTPPGELPPQVDPRQMSLLGAGWTLGSIKYLAQAGATSITYYETTGWRGVMETVQGSPVPEKFRSLPGSVFPLYHVLADVGEFAGGVTLPAVSDNNLAVETLAIRQDGRMRVLAANLTPERQAAAICGLAPQVRLRLLDERNAVEAMQQPEAFRSEQGEIRSTTDGTLTLDLLPFAVARIDG